ncbi:TerD family protein [Stenotrophomonas sp.]|uniref:TerD family protein n=1 Tax=Stenotrophomonas sp. TaxID=69392 RepID=UPI002FC82475
MNPMLLRRRSKVILRAGRAYQSREVMATLQTNLDALGFEMSPALCERVATLSRSALDTFYRQLIHLLREMLGAHRAYAPLYPDFPAQVMNASEAQRYWNAWQHYQGLLDQVGSATARAALAHRPRRRVLDLGTQEELDALFAQLVAARTPYSPEDRADVRWYVAQYRERALGLLPDAITCRENLAVVVAALLAEDGVADPRVLALGRHVRTATDVLRIAVALDDGDVSLAAPTRFGRYRRPLRRALLDWLERVPNRLEDLQRWTPRWVRLAERLHPGEHAARCPGVAADFSALRDGRRLQGFNAQVERALGADDMPAALALLRTRPGELARRLDVMARRSADPQAVVAAFGQAAPSVSTPVLLQVMTHFQHRSAPRPLRAFLPKGEVGKLYAIADTLAPLDAALCEALASCCEQALLARFATLPALGASYIDPALHRYLVPFSQRSASKALRTLVRGSRVPLPKDNTLRFFTWWRNGRSRVDIDLSAALFGEDLAYIDTLAYYNLVTYGAHHSGDIVDAPHGASEFIDVDIDVCRARGVRWVVMCLTSFSGQPYCDLPECFAGWMARTAPGSGEIYEPATVVDRFDLASNTTFCLPIAFDLVERQALWLDIGLSSHPRMLINVDSNLAGVSLMLRAMSSLPKTTLHTLFDLHVRARGHAVQDPNAARSVFAVHRGITPTDLPTITAEYL